jgi:hypothetical protein
LQAAILQFAPVIERFSRQNRPSDGEDHRLADTIPKFGTVKF